MITKVIEKYIQDVLDLYIQHGIQLTAKFSPSIDVLDFYSYENLFSHSATSNTQSQYRAVLLYTIGTPARPTDKFRNIKWGVYQQGGKSEPENSLVSPWQHINKIGDDQSETFYIGKSQSWNPDNLLAITRNVSFLEVPVQMKIITESLATTYDVYLLALQELFYKQEVKIQLNLENDGNTNEVEYWISFEDFNETTIQHLPEQEKNLLHTVSINSKLTGGYFSNFYKMQKTIQQVDLNLDINDKETPLIPHPIIKK